MPSEYESFCMALLIIEHKLDTSLTKLFIFVNENGSWTWPVIFNHAGLIHVQQPLLENYL